MANADSGNWLPWWRRALATVAMPIVIVYSLVRMALSGVKAKVEGMLGGGSEPPRGGADSLSARLSPEPRFTDVSGRSQARQALQRPVARVPEVDRELD